MQVSKFTTGDYVAHKIKINGFTSKFSAWFSADGELTDAEAIDAKGRSRPASDKAKKIIATMFGMVVAYSKR